VSPWFHVNHIRLDDAWRISGIDNVWDRNVALKRALGVPDDVFTRTVGILANRAPKPSN
jgi:hypothetical protein